MQLSKSFIILFSLFLYACGGGGGSDPLIQNTPSPNSNTTPASKLTPQSQADAARFLTQSTYGATESSIQALMNSNYEDWIDTQIALPQTHLQPIVETRSSADIANNTEDKVRRRHRNEAWWEIAVTADDQLRQRMAFALSQIFVVSDGASALTQQHIGFANYYDMLAKHAFGNFRTLLEDVTLHPIMGVYLSMLRNEKPDAARNVRPDENYAREVMQLFTIGLDQLNIDGTTKLDSQGQTIPTYDQNDIEGLAHVFTGWTYGGEPTKADKWWTVPKDFTRPMQAWQRYHDEYPKTILNNTQLPAGQTAALDLKMALDTLFNHPNVAPFISKQLIQRLITSNPSPAYVERVSNVFNDDGMGTKGNLEAVVKAILLDNEAINGHKQNTTSFGKLKEPVLRLSALWRALDAKPQNKRYHYDRARSNLGQSALRADSVFNFYRPDHKQPGKLNSQNKYAPEFAITTETTLTTTNNQFFTSIFNHNNQNATLSSADIAINITKALSLAETPQQLIDYLDLLLTANTLGENTHAIIAEHLNNIDISQANKRDERLLQRVKDAIYLVMASPQQAIQQ